MLNPSVALGGGPIVLGAPIAAIESGSCPSVPGWLIIVITVSRGVTVKPITQMLNVTVCVFPPPTAVIVATYWPVPAVERVTVAMSAAVAVPPAVSVTVGVRVQGRLALPGVETNTKLMVAVMLIVAAKLLTLAKLRRSAAVTNGPLLKTVTVSGTETS